MKKFLLFAILFTLFLPGLVFSQKLRIENSTGIDQIIVYAHVKVGDQTKVSAQIISQVSKLSDEEVMEVYLDFGKMNFSSKDSLLGCKILPGDSWVGYNGKTHPNGWVVDKWLNPPVITALQAEEKSILLISECNYIEVTGPVCIIQIILRSQQTGKYFVVAFTDLKEKDLIISLDQLSAYIKKKKAIFFSGGRIVPFPVKNNDNFEVVNYEVNNCVECYFGYKNGQTFKGIKISAATSIDKKEAFDKEILLYSKDFKCCDDYDKDNVCDEEDCAPADPLINYLIDKDGDGVNSCEDCNDNDPNIYPNAPGYDEYCNKIITDDPDPECQNDTIHIAYSWQTWVDLYNVNTKIFVRLWFVNPQKLNDFIFDKDRTEYTGEEWQISKITRVDCLGSISVIKVNAPYSDCISVLDPCPMDEGLFWESEWECLPKPAPKPLASNLKLESRVVEGNFIIYPNPASNYITVAGINGNIKIFDSLGQILYSGKNKKIDVSLFSPGIYFVKSGDQTSLFVKN